MKRSRRSKTPPRSAPSLGGRRTGRPVTALLDLLGRRWMLRVLWELRDERLTFRALRARCSDMSPSVLNRRISEMRAAGIVEPRAADGYRLTEDGRALLRALRPIRYWAERWAARARLPRARPRHGTR